MQKALICGIGGQDGSLLARLLLDKGYEVYGTSRNAQAVNMRNLDALGVTGNVRLVSATLGDFRSILNVLNDIRPSEVYNLSGQSSVGLSFSQPVETIDSITNSTINLIEAIRFLDSDIRFFNAGSSECFGDTGGALATEETLFQPQSPYGVAKSSAHWIVRNYREAYGLFACSGILFNHESPMRSKQFVTQKVIAAAVAIKRGEMDKLHLGNLDIYRDWGWAPEYVDAMWRMLQIDKPEDFIIATGSTNSLEDFVATAFAKVDLDWTDHVITDKSAFRPLDIVYSAGSPEKAARMLDWHPQTKMADVIAKMIKANLAG